MSESGGMGFWGWLILALVVCGLFGVGPCADCLHGCGPTQKQAE